MAGPGGRMMAGGGPDQRSMDFKGSGKRLVKQLAPERGALWVMLIAGVLSVAASVVGPKILGRATDLVFAGVIGNQIKDGTKTEAIARLRAAGDSGMADMLTGVDFTPGRGIDFSAVGEVLLVVLGVYVAAGLLLLV
ncbi:ABC transporter ATP-binding protein, partial [Streptomyces albidoflavus]